MTPTQTSGPPVEYSYGDPRHQLIARKWVVGKQIATQPGFRRGYPSMVTPMARKLGIGEQDARNCLRFYRLFPHLALDDSLAGLRELGALMPENSPLNWSRIRHQFLDKMKLYRTTRRVDARRLSADRVGQSWRMVDHARLMGLIGSER